MTYELKIKDVDTSETFKTTIEDLKELRELLKPYETKTIEVDVYKVKSKIRSDVKWKRWDITMNK